MLFKRKFILSLIKFNMNFILSLILSKGKNEKKLRRGTTDRIAAGFGAFRSAIRQHSSRIRQQKQ